MISSPVQRVFFLLRFLSVAGLFHQDLTGSEPEAVSIEWASFLAPALLE